MLEQIPVDPIWFPEALGIVKIDPADVIEGLWSTVTIPSNVLKRTRPRRDYHEYIYLGRKPRNPPSRCSQPRDQRDLNRLLRQFNWIRSMEWFFRKRYLFHALWQRSGSLSILYPSCERNRRATDILSA